MTAQEARDRVEWLEMVEVGREPVRIHGALVGASIETSRFELRTDEDLIKGKMSEAAAQEIQVILLGSFVIATIMITTSEHEEALIEPKSSYYLQDIREDKVVG